MLTQVYVLIFGVTFVIVGLATGMAWAFVEKPEPKGAEEPDLLRKDKLSALDTLAHVLAQLSYTKRFKLLLAEANLDWSVGRLVLQMLVAGVLAFAALLHVGWVPWYGSLALSVTVASIPLLHVQRLRSKRLRKVEDQLPEALEFLARALVAGHSLPMALELLGEEAEEPISTEVRKTVDEYNLGLSMEKSLSNMADRVPSVDIQFFVSAVTSQARTGGNLHDLLDSLAETIRDRETLRGQVRALTANGRITAIILTCLPFFIAGVMLMVNPQYLNILTNHPVGRLLILAGICGQALAFLVINRIVDIKV
jgi:tight adherence protein B